jgi:anti-sigma B factor antagonist
VARTTPPSAIVSRRSPAASARRSADHTVTLRGEDDLSTVAALTGIVARATARDDADLVLDLSRVRFMDAATIGLIVRAGNGLRARSRSFRLRPRPPRARRLFYLCGLAPLLDPVPADARLPGGVREPEGCAPVPAEVASAGLAASVARRRGP